MASSTTDNKKSASSPSAAGVISEQEFVALQSALLQVKQEKYEAVEKEQRAARELVKVKQQLAEIDQQLKKTNDLIAKSKDVKSTQLLQENENMKRLVDQTRIEAREQQEALKQHVRELSLLNDKLQQQLDAVEAEKKQLKQKQIESILSTSRSPSIDAADPSTSPSTSTLALPSSSSSSSTPPSSSASPGLVVSKEEILAKINNLGNDNDVSSADTIANVVIELLTQQNEASQKRVRSVQQQLSDENDLLRTAIEQARSEHSEALVSLSKEKDRSKSEVTALTQLLEKERIARKNDEDLKSKASSAEEQLRKLQSELDLMRGDREAVIAKVLSKDLALDELRDKFTAVQSDLQKAKTRADELQKERDALRFESAEAIEKQKLAAAKDHQIEELKRALEDLTAKRELDVGRLQEHTKQMAQQLQDRDSQIDQLSQQIQTLQKENKSLKSEIASLKFERENLSSQLQSANSSVAQLSEKFESSQKALATAEQSCQSTSQSLAQLTETHSQCSLQLEAAARSVAELRAAKESAENVLAERTKELESKAEHAKEEAQALIRVAEKKSAKLIKELQEQLQKERAAAARPAHERKKSTDISTLNRDSSDNNLAAMASTRTTPRSSAPPSRVQSSEFVVAQAATGPSSRHQRQLSTSKAEPTREMLLKETADLAQRLGELQTEKMELEEKNRHLIDSLKLLNAELDKRDGRAKPQPHTMTTMATGIGGHVRRVSATPALTHTAPSPSLSSPSASSTTPVSSPSKPTSSTSSQLEELGLKNQQLQKDLRMMGEEVARLMDENKKLKAATTAAPAPSSVVNTANT